MVIAVLVSKSVVLIFVEVKGIIVDLKAVDDSVSVVTVVVV